MKGHKKRPFGQVATNLNGCMDEEAARNDEEAEKEEKGDEEVAEILLSVRNIVRDHGEVILDTTENIPLPPDQKLRDMYSKDTFNNSKVGLKNLSLADFEVRLTALRAEMETRTGGFCSSKEHPLRPTKCKCLPDFLDLGRRKSATYDKPSYQRQLSSFLKLFQEVTTAATVHWQRSWTAQKAREAKAKENFRLGVAQPVESIDDYTEKHILELLSYFANFHYADCFVTKNTNKPRIAYSFGSYIGTGNLPIRFCGNTFFKILGIYSDKNKSSQLTLLNKVPAYRKKLLNNCARRVYMELFINGGLDDIYLKANTSALEDESQIAQRIRTIMEECSYGFKNELTDAANKVARFYLSHISIGTPQWVTVLHSSLPYPSLFGSSLSHTSNGIPVRSVPNLIRRGAGFQFRDVTLTHSMNGYVVDMRRYSSYFEAICLMKLRRPDITGMSVNSDSWLRYVASHGAIDGPVQLVYKLARGKEHSEKTFGPDNVSRITGSMLKSTADLEQTLQLANDFYNNGLMSVLEHVAKLEGMVSGKESLVDKFDVMADMGILWTKLTYKNAVLEEMEQRSKMVARKEQKKKDELLPLMQKVTSGHQKRERLFQALHTDIKAETLFAHQNSIDKRTGESNGDVFCVMFLAVVKEGMTLECQHQDGKRFLIELPFGHMLLVPSSFLHAGGFCTSLTGGLRLHMYADLLRRETGHHQRKLLGTVSRVGSNAEGNDYIKGDVQDRKHKDKTVYCAEDAEYHGEAVEIFDNLFNL